VVQGVSRLRLKRILVINVSRIGDTLLVTPALRALARHWPRASIDFLGHPKRYEVIRHLPFLASAGAITKHRAPYQGRLGAKRWDLALVYNYDRPLVAYALRVAERTVAFRQGDESLDGRLYRCVERPDPRKGHAAEHQLALPRALGVPDAGLRLAYKVTEDERHWARGFLSRELPSAPRPVIGLQVASFPTKGWRDWPVESFAELAGRIRARSSGAHFILLGGKLEKDRIDELARRLAGHALSVAGRLSLRESAALMNELDLYIGVDTGPTHIMGALEAPMVALYHCHSPSYRYGPRERPHCFSVDHPRSGGACGPETPMAELSVDAVWQRVRQALD
jgi:heptosyltransferase III